ncbi:hypothetical protein MTR_0911s0010 [Medicago truncatula]|uniref:Uncharacterized protein n=1 Tax=Medicago truncatula TaxID=3880 RepID=A0A072TEQ4_MEDTR|nr:hypothetical protein MTR_0911s0010 [Medicago truncatula]
MVNRGLPNVTRESNKERARRVSKETATSRVANNDRAISVNFHPRRGWSLPQHRDDLLNSATMSSNRKRI